MNPRDGRFRGRSVIVTGAGGDIGAATALRLAAEGAHLALFDRRLELVEDVAGRCQDLGGRVHAAGVDQTDRAQVEALGALDGLFANAGYGRFSTFLEQSQQEWQRHVDVNLTGTFNVCQAAARVMVSQRRGGVIVVNASSGATQYTDLLGAYCATKAALGMLVIGMASELGAHRIRVNAVLPGVIETGMTAPMLEGEAPHRDVLEAATPVGRLGSADDIANAVAFLASDEAAFVTGHSIAVDGGQTIHGHPQWYRTDYRDAHQDGWRVEP